MPSESGLPPHSCYKGTYYRWIPEENTE